MGTSVATAKYGTYNFDPIPQVGVRENRARLGASGRGTGPVERSVTLKGKLYGSSYNAVQTKVWALRAAFAQDGQALYWHDGTTLRINTAAKVMSVEIPEDWGEYEADYNIRLVYAPCDETHVAPVGATYNGYTFSPLPVFGREYTVQRSSDDATRDSAKVQVTLQGFIQKGSVSGNLSELNSLQTALAADTTLVYGGFSQSVRVQRFSHSPDLMDDVVSYTVVFDYDAEVAGDGVKKLVSSRRIQNSARLAVSTIPFLDDGAAFQIVGRNPQTIVANGYIIAESLAEARAAAAIEIAAQFPSVSPPNYSQITQQDITEVASENKVEWQVTTVYRIPVYTGGCYGGNPIYPG